jgi:hypothetical protein
VTNQATRTAIVHRANELCFGVSFQGPTDADRATVRYDNGRGAVVVKGKLDRVLASINAIVQAPTVWNGQTARQRVGGTFGS